MKTIAERIKEALHARDMIQSDLAEKSGLPKSAISSYMNGRYEPKQAAIHRLAVALDVDIPWLMGYDVPMKASEPASFDVMNGDVEAILEYLHKRPEAKALLSSSKKLTKEQLLVILNLIDSM